MTTGVEPIRAEFSTDVGSSTRKMHAIHGVNTGMLVVSMWCRWPREAERPEADERSESIPRRGKKDSGKPGSLFPKGILFRVFVRGRLPCTWPKAPVVAQRSDGVDLALVCRLSRRRCPCADYAEDAILLLHTHGRGFKAYADFTSSRVAKRKPVKGATRRTLTRRALVGKPHLAEEGWTTECKRVSDDTGLQVERRA